MVEKREKSLLSLFLKMNVSYTDIHNETIKGGYKLHRGTLEKYVRGEGAKNPDPGTIDAIQFGFGKVAEQWRPDMVAEINTFFDEHYPVGVKGDA